MQCNAKKLDADATTFFLCPPMQRWKIVYRRISFFRSDCFVPVGVEQRSEIKNRTDHTYERSKKIPPTTLRVVRSFLARRRRRHRRLRWIVIDKSSRAGRKGFVVEDKLAVGCLAAWKRSQMFRFEKLSSWIWGFCCNVTEDTKIESSWVYKPSKEFVSAHFRHQNRIINKLNRRFKKYLCTRKSTQSFNVG